MGLGDESDETLVKRAGEGDRTAAGLLVVRHTDKIMGVCYRMTGNHSAAQDATQETFLRLWKSAAKWEPQGAKFETWLYRVAMNVCLDRFRKIRREAPEEAAPEQIDSAPPADEQISREQDAAKVREAVASLPERQRRAIILSHYEELSNIEAAEIMETTVEAVEALLSRGRRALRDVLAADRHELMQRGIAQ